MVRVFVPNSCVSNDQSLYSPKLHKDAHLCELQPLCCVGKYDLDDGCNEQTINSLKLLFTEFPCRLIRSCHLLNKWLSYLVFGSLVFGSQEEGVPRNEGYIQVGSVLMS